MRRSHLVPSALLVAGLLLLAGAVRADREADTTTAPGAALEGVISAVTSPGPTVSILDGLISFDATGAEIVKPDGSAGTAADLVVGAHVAAFLKTPATSPLQATKVVVFGDVETATLRGPLDSVDTTAMTFDLLGLTVHVTDKTSFGGPGDGGGFSKLADLKTGSPVTALVTDQGGQITAIRVLVTAPASQPTERLRGTVKQIGTTSWTITDDDGKDVVITVTSDTKILGAPKVGDKVQVLGHPDSSGGFVAELIVALPAVQAPPTRLVGTVKSTGATSWVVTTGDGTDVTVTVTTETKIVGSPAVGDKVQVLGTRDASGNLVAQLIVKLMTEPPPSTDVTFTGTVKSIELGIWVVDTTKVFVTPRTEIEGSPKVGDTVKVTGKKMADGSVLATDIQKQ